MKKLMTLCSILLLGGVLWWSCSSDDDPQMSELEKKYFSIENAAYKGGEFPAATSTESIDGISVNNSALTGGMNFITIVTEVTYNRFFIGVKGVEGYWEYVPQSTPATRADGYNTYTIPIMYSTDYNSDITMMVSAETENGEVTEPYETEINFVESQSGDLNINLTFSNAKDVDLHLFMPNGEHIYYGARGGEYETPEGNIVTYGLDHDSNAGCSIDNLNNENIYIPAELIQAGTYTVVVDMYANCEPSIPTSWSVVARYKGNPVNNLIGSNPASGVYPAGHGNGDMTEVIKFTLDEGIQPNAVNTRIVPATFKAIQPTDTDLMKMEEAASRK